MTRKLWALSIALILTLSVVAGCGGSSTAPAPAAQEKKTEATAAKTTQYPVTLKDDEGKEVTISAEPKHIVSLAPSATEQVFALGKGGLLTGRTDFCDYPAEAKSIPSVGSLFPPSYEKIVGAQPDLILMMGGSADVKQKLTTEYKLPVLTLEPKTLDDIYKDVQMLGVAVNAQAQADKIVADMQAQFKAITDKTAKAATKPSVFFVASDEPIFTAGAGTFVDTLITLAGGTNPASDVNGWAQYSVEKLVAKDPAFIVAENQATVDKLKVKKGWDGLAAVKSGKLMPVGDLNLFVRPGPRMAQGLKWLAETIHPELFGK